MDSDLVKKFTIESGVSICEKPTSMSSDQVVFLTTMIMDEVLELLSTVHDADTSKEILNNIIKDGKVLEQEQYTDPDEQTASQADALVDIYYYCQNAACKRGINLSEIFRLVHKANMAKRNEETEQFIIGPGGKIMKPPGWTAPDIVAEIKRQKLE